MTSTLENLRSLEKCDTPRTIFFLTLPWESSRKCAGGKDEVYNTLPTFSHISGGKYGLQEFLAREVEHNGVSRGSRCTSDGVVYRYSFIIGRWEIVVIAINFNYCSKRYFCIQIVWKEIIEIRDSNHNSQD